MEELESTSRHFVFTRWWILVGQLNVYIQEQRLLHQPLLDSLASYVSFLLQQR